MENIRLLTFKFEVFLEEILLILYLIRTDNRSDTMLKLNFWILDCRRESNRGAFLALQQCWSVHLRIVMLTKIEFYKPFDFR